MSLRRRDGYTELVVANNGAIVSRLAQQDRVPWYSKPNLRFLYLLMFPTCLGVEMTSGFDSSMINGLQAISSWLEYFHYPRSALLGFMASSYALGFIVAAPFVPSVVDKMGRRYPILLGGVISILGGVIQGSALNATMFIAARFILGFASVFSVVAASSLLGELSHPNERATLSGHFNNFFHLGAVGAAGVIFGTFAIPNDWGWRIPSFLQVVPSLLQVSFIWLLPESPRWLISRGRGEEAHAILVKYHAEGDENSEFIQAEYTQIEQTLEAEQSISETGWKKVFSEAGMRKRLIIATFLALSVQWCGIGLISNFLAPILDTIGIHDYWTKNLINLANMSWALTNGTVTFVITHILPTLLWACTISLFLVFTSWTLANMGYSFTHNKIFAQLVLALIFLYSPAYNLAFTVLIYSFLVELFPFHVRAKGISIYQWWLRVAQFIAQVMNPIGIDAAGWKWYIVYCVWNAFQVVFIYFMLPETSGRTLEELTFMYESDQVEVLRHGGEVGTLREHREVETHYGTMESTRRTIGS